MYQNRPVFHKRLKSLCHLFILWFSSREESPENIHSEPGAADSLLCALSLTLCHHQAFCQHNDGFTALLAWLRTPSLYSMNPLCSLSSLFGGSPLLAGTKTAVGKLQPKAALSLPLWFTWHWAQPAPAPFRSLRWPLQTHMCTHTNMHVHMCAHTPFT